MHIYIGAIVCFLSWGVQVPQGDALILWPGTSAYEEKVHAMTLSPEVAHRVLVEKVTTRPDRFVDRTPIFLLGDEYFFAEPLKNKIGLQGFYISGMTGRIEHRTSSKTVERGARHLPSDPFQSIVVIDQP